MKLTPLIFLTAAVGCLIAPANRLPAATGAEGTVTEGTITGYADATKLIPLSLSGYTGEAAATLKFDLSIAGFDVESSKAQYQLAGSNNGRVEGRLMDNVTKSCLLAKAYTGGSLRSQAHALADDIAKQFNKLGVARTRIAFKATTGRTSEIYLADYDGHNATRVTQDGSIAVAPCWVPGRFALYYASYMQNDFPHVFYHDLAGGSRQMILRSTSYSPAVSPDGQRLAFISARAGSPDVYVSDRNGDNLKQLTTTKEDESSPCWSPDGQTICFASRESGRPALYTIPASGGAMRRLNTAGVLNCTEPDWSPDGKTLVFTCNMGGFSLCTVPATGGTATILTSGQDPSWAPNSRTVVFVSGSYGREHLSLLDVPTKRVKYIAAITGSSSQPSWAK